MKKLEVATLCTLVGANAFAANLADVNKVVEKLKRQGVIEQSACEPPSHARSLIFENVVLNGQKYDQVIASYFTGVNAPNRGLVFGYLKASDGRLYVSAVGDGDDIGTKLDGQPDLAFERSFDPKNAKDMAQLALAVVDPCSFEKSLETSGTKPNDRQRQLYDASVDFVLSR